MKVDLSIIIVTFNVQDLIADCLKSILLKNALVCEFIIIDNASTDNTVSIIESLNLEGLTLIKNIENVGFGPANNQGLPFVTGEFLLYLNPDTVISFPDTLLKMIEYMRSHTNVGIVGPRVVFADQRLQLSCGKMPTPFIAWMEAFSIPERVFKYIREYRYPFWDHSTVCEMDWVSGCCLFIRSELAQSLGGFDDNMLFYAEDIDLCTRVKNQGSKVIFNPESTITHLAGHSSKKDRHLALVRGFRSKIIFFKKYYGKNAAGFVKCGFSLSCVFKILFLLPVSIIKPKKYRDMLSAYIRAFVFLGKLKNERDF